MKHIKEITKKDLEKIKLIIFDCDGVIVRRGTKIKRDKNILTLEIKKIADEQIEQIKKLSDAGYLININSGRGLYMLLEMFRPVLDKISLTYENGSASWVKGRIIQHYFTHHSNLYLKLAKIQSEKIKGFEPKEFIITIHCSDRVKEIEETMKGQPFYYCIWNGEAYDIGLPRYQTKAMGVKYIARWHELKKENILAIGDNYNDFELLGQAGIAVTADKERLSGDFFVPLDGKELPAKILIENILCKTS